ncbi:MAG: hypothetical protein IPG29_12875 [Sphingobacteriales bacterium]|nr:hypothetical protein [Sphingobacteriales bacterium]
MVARTLDPAHEQADLPLSERKFIHRPKYFDAEISYFKARVITPNGTVRPLIPTDNTEKETIRYDGSLHHAFAYQFNLAGLKPNDVLQIQYQIYLPYNFDWMRWFFIIQLCPNNKQKLYWYTQNANILFLIMATMPTPPKIRL